MIKCSEYDYIEIVCLYRYPIKITLHNDEFIEGIAMDTVRNKQREECIKIKQENQLIDVVLDHICELQVCIENPHFHIISFQ